MGKSGNERIGKIQEAKPSPSKGRLKAVKPKSETAGEKEPVLRLSYKAVDDKDLLAIISMVRDGISTRDFNAIASATPFTLAEWAQFLQVSERTIQRNQKDRKAFQPIQSEKIVELAMLYRYGIEVFGDQENFNSWLSYKSIALGGSAPRELLDTQFGIGMVKDALGRIEQGVLA